MGGWLLIHYVVNRTIQHYQIQPDDDGQNNRQISFDAVSFSTEQCLANVCALTSSRFPFRWPKFANLQILDGLIAIRTAVKKYETC